MTQALPKLITFEKFIDWLPENSGISYELHNGNIIEMAQPAGEHEEVTGFLTIKLSALIDRLNLSYSIPNKVIVKPPQKDTGYFPDILLLNRADLVNEALWKKASTLTNAASIPLIIEVVSTNWRDDYHFKYADYDLLNLAHLGGLCNCSPSLLGRGRMVG